jgi:hypothetical protein
MELMTFLVGVACGALTLIALDLAQRSWVHRGSARPAQWYRSSSRTLPRNTQ